MINIYNFKFLIGYKGCNDQIIENRDEWRKKRGRDEEIREIKNTIEILCKN